AFFGETAAASSIYIGVSKIQPCDAGCGQSNRADWRILSGSGTLPDVVFRCAGVGVDGNAHGEDGTAAQLADHGDRASVSRYDDLGNGQAHAGSRGCIAVVPTAVELVEDQRLLERVDADTAIGDADH